MILKLLLAKKFTVTNCLTKGSHPRRYLFVKISRSILIKSFWRCLSRTQNVTELESYVVFYIKYILYGDLWYVLKIAFLKWNFVHKKSFQTNSYSIWHSYLSNLGNVKRAISYIVVVFDQFEILPILTCME